MADLAVIYVAHVQGSQASVQGYFTQVQARLQLGNGTTRIDCTQWLDAAVHCWVNPTRHHGVVGICHEYHVPEEMRINSRHVTSDHQELLVDRRAHTA